MQIFQGLGLAIFPGGGAWLSRRLSTGRRPRQEALVLTDPERILVANTCEEVPRLLAEIEREQNRGNFAAGYLTYEAGGAFDLPVQEPGPGPLAWMAVYSPETVRSVTYEDWFGISRRSCQPTSALHPGSSPALNVTRAAYIAAVSQVRNLIAAGDTYQVNYTVRARFELQANSLDYFMARVAAHPVPYAAFLDRGDAQIISLSPELFLRRDGSKLESHPMKGTRARATSLKDDIDLAYDLATHEKDRAENLMIVDMVRNDLGRVCRTGSVRVPTLYAVEPYRTVWQMVSTVAGELSPAADLTEIMAATFPGASVTGAPKHHTMEIIRDLEIEHRGIYTGAICLFFPQGDFTCNLAIRTITCQEGFCVLGVGSGVVWDSDPGEEYEETLTKAAFAFPSAKPASPSATPAYPRPPFRHADSPSDKAGVDLFETLLLEPAPDAIARAVEPMSTLSRYRFLDDHLDRMAGSAKALGMPFARETAMALLSEYAGGNAASAVLRLSLDSAGKLSLLARAAPHPPAEAVQLLVSPFRTDPDNPDLLHKTTARDLYDRERQRATREGFFEVIFLNRLGHVTEGTITNVFARFRDEWVTPPLTDGLLPGIWRGHFLRETHAAESSIGLEDLAVADEIVIGNSVRGAVRVIEIVTRPFVK